MTKRRAMLMCTLISVAIVLAVAWIAADDLGEILAIFVGMIGQFTIGVYYGRSIGRG